MSAFCQWWDRSLEDVTEHQQEKCYGYGWDCTDCPYFGDETDNTKED